MESSPYVSRMKRWMKKREMFTQPLPQNVQPPPARCSVLRWHLNLALLRWNKSCVLQCTNHCILLNHPLFLFCAQTYYAGQRALLGFSRLLLPPRSAAHQLQNDLLSKALKEWILPLPCFGSDSPGWMYPLSIFRFITTLKPTCSWTAQLLSEGGGARESDSQVTWLQQALTRFWMEKRNKRQGCCQQAIFHTGNVVCGSNSVQQSGCILTSCCAVMRNNANAAHTVLQ